MTDSSKQAALLPFEGLMVKEEATRVLSNYGMLPRDPERQKLLDSPNFQHGDAFYALDADGAKFLFVSVDMMWRYSLKYIRIEYLAPFIFTSEDDGILYFALEAGSQAY